MKRTVAAIGLLFACVLPLLAASPVTDVELLRQEARGLLAKGDTRWLELDTSGDGKIDHVMLLSRRGDKVYEEIDLDGDGRMDDLCFYSRGVIIREETDTNYDGKIDLWVFIHEGVYIERYARDTDFDGTIDATKEYGGGKQK